ncbi:Hydrolase [Sarracenia purpurea var. burkii]
MEKKAAVRHIIKHLARNFFSGNFTYEEILTMLPYKTALYKVGVLGSDLRAALEHSISKHNVVQKEVEITGEFLHVAGKKAAVCKFFAYFTRNRRLCGKIGDGRAAARRTTIATVSITETTTQLYQRILRFRQIRLERRQYVNYALSKRE